MVPPDRSLRCFLFACALQLALPRESRAEGALSYKFQSWQEDDGRVRVDSHYGMAEQSLPADAKLKLSGVVDTITGATPTGEAPATPGGSVPLSEIDDRRTAWQLEASKQFHAVNVSLGYAKSRESDYISDGWSINTATDLNQKNTTLLIGLGGTSDDVKVFFQTPWEHKRSLDAIVGVTQLINPTTTASFNLTYGRATGFLADPYKLIEKHVDLGGGLILRRTFGENRPDEREKWIGHASLNHSFAELNGAIESSYRLYHDTFGITSHTLSVAWFQKLAGDRLIVNPAVRLYQQSAADFYRLTLDGTTITPGSRPDPKGPFYSADYRLSKMRTTDLGLKLIFVAIPDRLTFDVSYDRYTMRGRDGFTPASAYADAHVFTVGGKWSW